MTVSQLKALKVTVSFLATVSIAVLVTAGFYCCFTRCTLQSCRSMGRRTDASHIQKLGQQVRITSEVTKNGKPMGPRQLYYEINEWGAYGQSRFVTRRY